MNKQLCIVTFFLLLLSVLASAELVSISLVSPRDNAPVTSYSVDFIYDFDQHPSLINCSLFINDEVKGFRNALLQTNNNKISLDFEEGSYEWYMKCVDTEHNEIVSETRKFSIYVESQIPEEGYETIYNSNGLRTYVITPKRGMDAVELPAMKGGEYIKIMISGKAYYLDIIKMGSHVDTSFVDVRDRSSSKIHKMLVGDSLVFDFDKDETIETGLSLIEVERNINAYFVVTPYPDSEPEPVEEEVVVEEEPEEIEEDEIITETEQTVEEEDEEQEAEQKEQEKEQVKSFIDELGLKTYFWPILLGIVIVLIIIFVIVLVVVKKKSKPKPISESGKEEKIVLKKEKTEKLLSEDDWPVHKESFDVIKSTGRGKKKK